MVKVWPLVVAGLVTFLIAVVGNPLWLALESSWAYADWLIWALGITMLALSGILLYLNRWTFLQYLFGLWGWTWTILFFFQVFPNFSISLL